jgi:hypothetical protein
MLSSDFTFARAGHSAMQVVLFTPLINKELFYQACGLLIGIRSDTSNTVNKWSTQ